MIENDIKSLRQKIRKGPSDKLISIKPFATGMYGFIMIMINYYSRVREQLKIDYDSFMIVQTVVSHSLYQLNKKKIGSKSYFELEKEWAKLFANKNEVTQMLDRRDLADNYSRWNSNQEEALEKNYPKLTISSICLVTSLPKETVRRKVNELIKKNLLIISKKNGITLGSMYRKVFHEFTPQTTKEVTKLIKNWEKSGILKSILSFKI
jgi:hypothetical protein